MPQRNNSFFDKTFNLAGALRSFFLALMLGLVVLIIFVFSGIRSDVWLSILSGIIVVLAVVWAVRGARSAPQQVSDATKKWVGSTRVIRAGGIVDKFVPEEITIRRFLIWTAIIIILIASFIFL